MSRNGALVPLWPALTAVVTVLLLLVVAHDVDHVVNERRLGELSAAFWMFLPFQYAAFLGALALTLRRHAQAPTAVAALSAASAIAFGGAHLLPFGLLPYADGEPLAISWALVFVPMAVAIVAFGLALHARPRRRSSLRVG